MNMKKSDKKTLKVPASHVDNKDMNATPATQGATTMRTSVNAAGVQIGDTIIGDNYERPMDARVVGFRKYRIGERGLIRVYARAGRYEIPRMFTYTQGEGITVRRDS